MTTGLPNFFKHNLWANMRLLDACSSLSDTQLDTTTSGIFGSIRETLLHIFSAEEGYASSVTGKLLPTRLKDLTTFPGFDELRQRAQQSGEALIAFAEQGDFDKILYLDQGTYEAPVIIVLIQAIYHATDHRSQIATLLSQQNIQAPDLDGWDYNDAMH